MFLFNRAAGTLRKSWKVVFGVCAWGDAAVPTNRFQAAPPLFVLNMDDRRPFSESRPPANILESSYSAYFHESRLTFTRGPKLPRPLPLFAPNRPSGRGQHHRTSLRHILARVCRPASCSGGRRFTGRPLQVVGPLLRPTVTSPGGIEDRAGAAFFCGHRRL